MAMTKTWRCMVAATLVCAAAPWPEPVAEAQQAVSLPARSQQIAAAKNRAIEQILLSSRGEDPFLRANAIEAIAPVPGRAMPMAQLGLDDAHPAVRYAALITAGKLQFKSLAPVVQKQLQHPSPSVRAAAIYASTRLGLQVDSSQLADMLMSKEPGVRANAAIVLGLMGDESAVPMMHELGKKPLGRAATPPQQSVYRVQLAEALVQLGDETAMEPLRAGAYSNFDEVRILSILALGRLKDRQWESGIAAIMNRPPIQVQLAAARALLEMGSRMDTRSVVLRGAAYNEAAVLDEARQMSRELRDADESEVVKQLLADARAREATAATIRGQAAFALGFIDDPQAAAALVKLLDDPSEQVRLSAAAAIVRASETGGALSQAGVR